MQRLAQEGTIHGLISLDPDPMRSFSADPLRDPFDIDRRTWPKGTAWYNPRTVRYFVKLAAVELPL